MAFLPSLSVAVESLPAQQAVRERAAQIERQLQLDEARLAIGQQRYAQAQRLLQDLAAQQGQSVEFQEQIVALLQEAQRLHLLAEQGRQHERRQLVLADKMQQRERQEREQRSLLDERVHRILDLQQKGFLDIALERARLLLTDYPQSDLANETYAQLLQAVHKQRKLTHDQRLREMQQEISEGITRSMIPRGIDGAPIFPEDWSLRTLEREAQAALDDGQDLAFLNRLAEHVSVSFQDLEPAACIDLLSQKVGINMVVDSALRSMPPRNVTLHARNMRVDNVLNWIAQQAEVQWRSKDRVIFVGGEDDSAVITRIYDVGALLYKTPDFHGVQMGLASGDEGMELIQDFEEDEGLAPEDLTDLMVLTLGEDLWERDGHGLNVYGTQLVASCTPILHTQITEFLRRMRQSDDILVGVRTRWLELNKNFAEEIGVDWQDPTTGPVFPAGFPNLPFAYDQGLHDPGTPNPTGRMGWWRQGGQYATAGSVENILPGGGLISSALDSSLSASGLTLSFGYLGALQVAAIFKATEQSKQARLLDSIELTTRNGVTGNAYMGRSQAYIADYDIVTDGVDLGHYDMTIKTLNTGYLLEATPLVSADRRYVTLDLDPKQIDATFTTSTIEVRQVVAYESNGEQIVYYMASFSFDIQLPRVELNGAHTRVMIPDKGSVLIGGLRQSIREGSQAQVPVLGNIPFLGRLFGRRARYEVDRDLYLMATVKIFLYPELEAQL